MGGFFSTPKPPKPDTSAIDRQVRFQGNEAALRKKHNQSRIRNLRARRGGRANPFLFASLQDPLAAGGPAFGNSAPIGGARADRESVKALHRITAGAGGGGFIGPGGEGQADEKPGPGRIGDGKEDTGNQKRRVDHFLPIIMRKEKVDNKLAAEILNGIAAGKRILPPTTIANDGVTDVNVGGYRLDGKVAELLKRALTATPETAVQIRRAFVEDRRESSLKPFSQRGEISKTRDLFRKTPLGKSPFRGDALGEPFPVDRIQEEAFNQILNKRLEGGIFTADFLKEVLRKLDRGEREARGRGGAVFHSFGGG